MTLNAFEVRAQRRIHFERSTEKTYDVTQIVKHKYNISR